MSDLPIFHPNQEPSARSPQFKMDMGKLREKLKRIYSFLYEEILHIWTDGIYEPVEDGEIEQIILREAKNEFDYLTVPEISKNEIINNLKDSNFMKLDEVRERNDKNLLAFTNGYIDMRDIGIKIQLHKFTLEDSHKKKPLFFIKIPHDINENYLYRITENGTD